MNLEKQIKEDIEKNPIILYMKGTKEMPMCGVSNSVVQALNHYGVDYKDVNILEDPNIRIKLSEHSGWPTIPQLFVKGELIGGADITVELHQNGQLLDILDNISTPLHLILLYALVQKVDGRLLIEESGKYEFELNGFEEESNKIKCRPHLSIPISYMLSNYLKIDDIDCCIQLRKPLSQEENKLIKIIRGRKFGELESISIGYKNGKMDLFKIREFKRAAIESRLIDHIQKGGYHNIEYKVQGGNLVHFVNERVIKI